MLTPNTDSIALRAQADIERFFSRVVCPALAELQPGPALPGGVTHDLGVFLEAARVGTHNALCAEARMAFALTIGAAFERHLRRWLVHRLPAERKKLQREPGWQNLAGRVSELVDDDMSSLPIDVDLEELWLLVSTVRHGDGPACTSLQARAPHLWEHLGGDEHLEVIDDGMASFNMQVSDLDLGRYAHAIMAFWGYLGATTLGGGDGRRGVYVPIAYLG